MFSATRRTGLILITPLFFLFTIYLINSMINTFASEDPVAIDYLTLGTNVSGFFLCLLSFINLYHLQTVETMEYDHID